jgi:hypothetical protein
MWQAAKDGEGAKDDTMAMVTCRYIVIVVVTIVVVVVN